MSTQLQTLLSVAKTREEKIVTKQGKAEKSDFDVRFRNRILTERKTGTYCIPPTIKARLLTTLKSDIKGRIGNYDSITTDEDAKTRHLQSIVKRMATYNRIIENTKSCDVSKAGRWNPKGKALEKEMALITDNFNEAEILDIARELKGETSDGKPPKLKTDTEMIFSEYKRVWRELRALAYDGMDEEKDQSVLSICGNPIEVGLGSDAVQPTLDKMAWFGSYDDWFDYYFLGDDSVIHSNGTFRPLSDDDKKGCAPIFLVDKLRPLEEEDTKDVKITKEEKSKIQKRPKKEKVDE
ncbi:MAG: hypothetical protein HeimC3_55210 [Candidatus Heimdallarchaeota archaeon LC_3]|nr:MAG: hypothetical protein HeimC3_55210 [Candidatus Heimdallarchaeota archaeon LC_3]